MILGTTAIYRNVSFLYLINDYTRKKINTALDESLILELIAVASAGNIERLNELLAVPMILELVSSPHPNKDIYGLDYKTYDYQYEPIGQLAVLTNAIKKGTVEVVERLLQIPSVRTRAIVCGQYMLCLAARRENSNILDSLLTVPGIYHQVSANGNSVLVEAVFQRKIAIVKRLLSIPEVTERLIIDNKIIGFWNENYLRHIVPEELNRYYYTIQYLNRGIFRLDAELENHLNAIEQLLQIPEIYEGITVNLLYILHLYIFSSNWCQMERLLRVPALQKQLISHPATLPRVIAKILEVMKEQEYFTDTVTSIFTILKKLAYENNISIAPPLSEEQLSIFDNVIKHNISLYELLLSNTDLSDIPTIDMTSSPTCSSSISDDIIEDHSLFYKATNWCRSMLSTDYITPDNHEEHAEPKAKRQRR